MAEENENERDDPGTDPETQRQEITRRGYVAHPENEPQRWEGTKKEGEVEKKEGEP
jgi:hypothetical protein